MNAHERQNIVERILDRRVQNLFPSRDEVVARLAASEPLQIYWGIDPTGDQVHIGHTVPLLLLRDLADLGHSITLLIGDFTARIGDPTGKSTARVSLTGEQVQENMMTYLDQVKKVLSDRSFAVAYNSEWLSGLGLEQVLKLMSMVTVQQMIQRDMFQERLKADQPIYLNEFLYPLMQGYDSVALRADGEVGGNDQTFNMLMGRDLEKTLLQKNKIVLATHLLADPVTGKKMSKSEGPLIALNDSPQEIRRKVLALDDSLTKTVYTLCTAKEQEWIDQQSSDPRAFKESLAAELIRMYHGEAAVTHAEEAIEVSVTGPLDKVLKESGLASSMSEAKRLIDQGGITVNGVKASQWDLEIKSGDELKVGKGKFVKVK
jgi:tyrosyl-tRNA synthetase